MIHGLVLDPNRGMPGSILLGGRVVAGESIKPGAKLSIKYEGRTMGTANQGVAGFYRGRVLFGRSFLEETRMGDLTRAWRSGEWLHVHLYLRATLGLAGFLSLVTGLLATWALLADTTAASLFLLGRGVHAGGDRPRIREGAVKRAGLKMFIQGPGETTWRRMLRLGRDQHPRDTAYGLSAGRDYLAPSGLEGGPGSSRTRASTASAPRGLTTRGFRSISAISGWASTRALTRSSTSVSALTSTGGAPR